MHAESSFKDLDYSTEKCQKLAEDILTNGNYLCVVAEDEDGAFHGFFVGYIIDYYFGDDLIAEDLLLYIVPGMRGVGAAKRLISYFESWASVNGASYVCLGATTGVDEEKTIGFYKKLGYHHKGTLMQKYLM